MRLKQEKIIVSCGKFMAPYVIKELMTLGYPIVEQDHMQVSTLGYFKDVMFLNLHLRTATRILWPIAEFNATHPSHLYKQIKKLPWEDFFDAEAYISINSYVHNDFINDTRFANVKVKDAIVDRFNDLQGKRPDSGPLRHGVNIFLHWVLDKCQLYFDTSGDPIAKHGYRKLPYKAPMMESLAAATILATDWDGNSNFVNPMCGSGTIAIEAAMMVSKTPPGLFREKFGFMALKEFIPSQWETLLDEAKQQIIEQPGVKIIANDNNNNALNAARQNAEAANVSHLIDFVYGDFQTVETPEGAGVVIVNPEYGERLGEEEALAAVYKQIGDYFKQQCKGYMGYIFTGNMNLSKKVGLKARRRIEFLNGKIECRLLEYELYAGTKRAD